MERESLAMAKRELGNGGGLMAEKREKCTLLHCAMVADASNMARGRASLSQDEREQ